MPSRPMWCPVLVALLLWPRPAPATWLEDRREWVAFEGLGEPPLRFETRIPASCAWTDGPDGRRAVSVAVPELERDEKACAVALDLPALPGRHNALRLWVRGSAATRRLEIVVRTSAGAFAADVPLEPGWRQVIVGPHNATPWFSPEATTFDLSQATGLRFCIGLWQGHAAGEHEFALGPVEALYSPSFTQAPPAESLAASRIPVPLQPLLVELLDLNRGQWQFLEPLGGRLALAGPVAGYAFPLRRADDVRVAYLCCDPEFPDDPEHGTLKAAPPVSTGADAQWFRLEDAGLSCALRVQPVREGVLRCELHDIRLEPATASDRYVAALYLQVGGELCPVHLVAGDQPAPLFPRLLTNRVGNVFVGGEPCRVWLAGIGPDREPTREFVLRARDYATGEVVWEHRLTCSFDGPSGLHRELTVPLTRFGVFEVTAETAGCPTTSVRVCRVPRPRAVDPDHSQMGMNLFQQQLWWYAYQVPLMQQAGVRWLRPWLAWENTWRLQEPRAGEWDTRSLDAALRRMDAHGLRYEYILFAAPDWVADPAGSSVPPAEKMDQWAAWVEKLVARYRDRVRVWEVWNEPDLMWPEATRHSGEHYLAMLKATHEAARRADPDCTVQGLSHAGYEEWLTRVGDLGAAPYMDQVTIHSYAAPREFPAAIQRRLDLLAAHGLGGKPVWINEFGAPAWDSSPAYSAKYGCSERRQAEVLVANYAQAFALTGQPAFWFCTLDPRDPAHESQWTWDAGIGVLYLGLLPKLSYAALAGVAQELDARTCFGRVDVGRTLHQVSFEGPVSVVWSDDPSTSVPATEVGCAAGERLAVRDMFTNVVAAGDAEGLTLDLSRGPVYVEGSRQLAAIARVESAVRVEPSALALARGASAQAVIDAPAGAITTFVLPADPSTRFAVPLGTNPPGTLAVAVPADAPRSEDVVRIEVRAGRGVCGLLAPVSVKRALRIVVAEPNLIRDGSFVLGNLFEWSPERTSPHALDEAVGHRAPGSLRLDGPFDRRLVQFSLPVVGARDLHFAFWAKTEALADAEVTANVALFAADRWLTSPCLASIPGGTSDWTLVEGTLPADRVPAETKTVAFYLDAAGRGSGTIWFDDLDLWQPGR